MQRLFFLILLLLVSGQLAEAQKFTLSKSNVVFFSDATIEDITAFNKKTAGLFNSANGEIAFSVPISEFEFDKSLMKEHFNEKYMESDKYPKSTFKGKINGFKSDESGEQKVTANGQLTIHGVTKDIDVPGTIVKQGDTYVMNSKFIVKLADYNIAIPQLLWNNIAEQVEVTLDLTFKPQK